MTTGTGSSPNEQVKATQMCRESESVIIVMCQYLVSRGMTSERVTAKLTTMIQFLSQSAIANVT